LQKFSAGKLLCHKIFLSGKWNVSGIFASFFAAKATMNSQNIRVSSRCLHNQTVFCSFLVKHYTQSL
ncbi:MAG: hypothetical protein QM579_02585, partial [Desulfovibrio sp.]|uniref:hypothetical protein n=1 Tax=Desulfovibrio sp. TaxID=885 RepID=UPI0039E6307A